MIDLMKLSIAIEIDDLPDEKGRELGRILRYWAGAMEQLDLDAPVEHQLMDSDYKPVGTLTIA